LGSVSCPLSNHLTAFWTRAAILASSAAVNSFSYAAGIPSYNHFRSCQYRILTAIGTMVTTITRKTKGSV
jgi:hypothetical protein